MESITNKQINNVLIGEYPLTISSQHLKAIWDACVGNSDVWYLKYIKIEAYLSAMATKALKAKANEQYDRVDEIRQFLKGMVRDKAIIDAQSEIIRTQELDLLRYEVENRKLKHSLKVHEEDKLF